MVVDEDDESKDVRELIYWLQRRSREQADWSRSLKRRELFWLTIVLVCIFLGGVMLGISIGIAIHGLAGAH
jgi:F0F1-type ATP synthase assembly protein I